MKYKELILLSFTALTLWSCNQSESNTTATTEKVTNDQTNTVWVVNQIFEAARTSKYDALLTLCNPNGT